MALILMLFKVLLLATAAILEMHRNKNHSAATKARIKAACSFLVDFLFFFLKKTKTQNPPKMWLHTLQQGQLHAATWLEAE